MVQRRTLRQIAALLIISGTALTAHAESPKKKAKPAPPPRPHLNQAYYAGHLVNFHSVPGKDAKHTRLVGTWNLGEKVSPKRNDKRPNLYFVSPGLLHRSENHPEQDHNEVVSAVPEEASFFDVYWVVVLDPSVYQDFTSEQEIILATQETFVPAEDFRFDEIPSAGFLRTFLKITDLDGLEKYRRPDGGLPEVAIIPAGFAVKAIAEEIPEAVAPEAQQGTTPKSTSP